MSAAPKPTELRDTGISVLGRMPWSTHASLFYETTADLLDVVVPFFKAGLEGGELCVWVPADQATEMAGRTALANAVPDFERHVANHALQILDGEAFYRPQGSFSASNATREWRRLLERVRDNGYAGLRWSDDMTWLEANDWRAFSDFEEASHDFVRGRRILFLCAYPLAQRRPGDIFDSARAHDVVLARRQGKWDILETPALKRTKAEIQRRNADLEQRVAERTRELARSWEYLIEAQRLSHTGSFAFDVATREYTFWSPELFRIFGFDPGNKPPSLAQVFERIHPADRATCQEALDAARSQKRDFLIDARVVLPDGRTRYIQKLVHAVTREAGRAVEVLGSYIDVTERKRASARLAKARRVARERALEERYAAALEERTRLAREVHDTLLQGVTGVALQLRALLPRVRGAPATVTESLRGVVELAESTIREARQAVWDMRSPMLVQKGLPRALQEATHLADGDRKVQFKVSGEARPLSPQTEDTIFRVGQEAVSNAVKHADPRRVDVKLEYKKKSVRLTVADDGRGFHVSETLGAYGGRWGLLGMRERADRVGGALRIRSTPDHGTIVTLQVPLVDASPKK